MRKKSKLYTVNKWNRPAFMPERNLFAFAGQMQNSGGLNPSTFFSHQGGGVYGDTNGTNASRITPVQGVPFNNGFDQDLFRRADSFKPEVKPVNTNKPQQVTVKPTTMQGIGAAANAIGSIQTGERRGMFDTLDPLHHLAGGKESGFGNVMGDAGVGLFQAGASTGNPYLMAAGAAAKIVGDVGNMAFGISTDKEKLDAVNNSISANKNFVSNASSFDDIQGPTAMVDSSGIYKGGWFSGGKARKKQAAIDKTNRDAFLFAQNNVENNVNNISDDQLNNALANYSAFGGPLEILGNNDMEAINYGFMSDYLTTKKKEAAAKNKTAGLVQAPVFMPQSFALGGCLPQQGLFALGGDIQTNGSDFSTGLVHIDAGGSHSENPNEGVQVGVDNEGTPNLVEENETIFDDYVYSTRILADATTKQMFRLPRARKISFADISKKLEKEASERPNDPISIAGLREQMHQLADQQERQKQEMEAQRAKEAFEALSPEEQAAIMQRAAQEEQAAQQQQAMAEQQAMQQQMLNDNPDNMGQPQEQEYNVGEEPQMFAGGGRINRFDNGGKAYTKMLNSLGFHTQGEFEKWAEENGIDFGDLWKNTPNTLNNDILGELWKNEKFKEALRKNNPALAHAFEDKGYDFGAYQPEGNGKATIQSISKGNWKTTNGKGWRGSEDLAFKQATEGLSDEEIDALTTEQLAERMRGTEAYQNTNKWLQNGDNALMYLTTLMNDPDTPQVAKDYAAKFVKDGKWKDGFDYDYATVFGSNGKGVRETNPGTYWHTAMEANRGNQAQNFVINDDGSIEAIVGDVPTDWTAAGNYAWATPENDIAYNYYRRPAAAAPGTPATTPEEETAPAGNNKNLAPKHNWEGWRYAGLFGPAVGLGMMASGVGKPDYSGLDAAVTAANRPAYLARYKPLGNYLTYRPLDIFYEQNRMDANARATDRAILNTSGMNRGTAMAGLIANGYNSQIADGNLFRQALEYNDNLRKQVAEFNRGTDQFNSEAYNRTSQFNADARNRAGQYAASLAMQSAAQKIDADAGWYNSLYGNVGGLFKGISDIGVENKRDNMINWMISKGIFGSVDPNDPEMKKRVKAVS